MKEEGANAAVECLARVERASTDECLRGTTSILDCDFEWDHVKLHSYVDAG